VHPGQEFMLLPDTKGAILIAFGLFFAWLGPAMIVGDLLVALMPRSQASAGRGGSSLSESKSEGFNNEPAKSVGIPDPCWNASRDCRGGHLMVAARPQRSRRCRARALSGDLAALPRTESRIGAVD